MENNEMDSNIKTKCQVNIEKNKHEIEFIGDIEQQELSHENVFEVENPLDIYAEGNQDDNMQESLDIQRDGLVEWITDDEYAGKSNAFGDQTASTETMKDAKEVIDLKVEPLHMNVSTEVSTLNEEHVVDNRHSLPAITKTKNGIRCSFCKRGFRQHILFEMHLCTMSGQSIYKYVFLINLWNFYKIIFCLLDVRIAMKL